MAEENAESCRPDEAVMAELKQLYNSRVVDHAVNPRNFGEMARPDGVGEASNAHGDVMRIYLRVRDGKVREASFWTDSCGASVACFSVVTEMVKGRTPVQAMSIGAEDVLRELGGLPEGNEHCAALATGALKSAVQDYLALEKEPWKKAYRR